ncbi:MAG: ATP-binding protein [Mycobacteriales bacterium]
MATVELLLSPLPVHVRTARLVSVAAARRAGLPDELVDELRFAVGEACSRAVALHIAHAPDTLVKVVLRDDAAGLTVEITDAGPSAEPLTGEPSIEGDDVDPQVSLAVLSGLVDDLTITPADSGTTVALRWPLPPKAP